MNTRYLREFVVLADTLSYSEAAENLYISQSSLSKHLQTLEKELGTPLFFRTTRSIRLTHAGSVFLNYAKKISALAAEAEAELNSISRSLDNSFLVGVMQNPQFYNLAEYMLSFQKVCPNVSYTLIESDEQGLFNMYQKKHFNLFCTLQPLTKDIDFGYMPMYKSHLVAIMNKDCPLAEKEELSLLDLAEEKLLTPARYSTMSKIVQGSFLQQGIRPNIIYEGSSTGSIELIKSGLGIALHSIEFAKHACTDPSLVIREITPALEFTYGIGYRNEQQLSSSEKKYLNYLRKYELK